MAVRVRLYHNEAVVLEDAQLSITALSVTCAAQHHTVTILLQHVLRCDWCCAVVFSNNF